MKSFPIPSRSLLRPHRQFVATRISEVEATAPGKRERIFADDTTGLAHLLLDSHEIAGVKHHQRTSPNHFALFGKAARDAAILKAGVVRPVVGELPSESPLVKG